MDRPEARDIAQGARAQHGVPAEAEPGSVIRQFIEVAGDDPEIAGPVRDVLAWIVRFEFEDSWVDLAVADESGEIVRVKWSRGALQRREESQLRERA
jgi:hypothetical protein